jgi:hypothetical protein
LVEPLVHSVSIADPLSDSCEVSNYNRSYPSFVEGICESRRDLMQEILNLVADSFLLTFSCARQTLPAPTAALFSVDLSVEFCRRPVVLAA